MRLRSRQSSLKWKTDATRGTREAGSIGKKEWRYSGCKRREKGKNEPSPQQAGGNSVLVSASVSVAASICSVLLYLSMFLNFSGFFLPSVSPVLPSFSEPVGQLERGERREERQRRRAVSVHNWSWQCRCPLIPVYSYSSTCTVLSLIFHITHSIHLLMDISSYLPL